MKIHPLCAILGFGLIIISSFSAGLLWTSLPVPANEPWWPAMIIAATCIYGIVHGVGFFIHAIGGWWG